MENSYLKEQRYLKAKKRVKDIKGFYSHFMVYILVNVFISSIITYGLMYDEQISFWKAITHPGVYMTWLGWGIGVFVHWLSVFGFPFFISKDWEERKIKELIQKEEQKQTKYLN